jgi:hypothetical protein
MQGVLNVSRPPQRMVCKVVPAISHGLYAAISNSNNVVSRGVCIGNCTDGNTPEGCHDYATPDMHPTYMSTSKTEWGPWSSPGTPLIRI